MPADKNSVIRWLVLALCFGLVAILLLPIMFMIAGALGLIGPSEQDVAKNVKEAQVSTASMKRTGTILMALPTELVSVDVLTGKSTSLYRTSGDWIVEGCAGPNRHGFIAIIENDMRAKRHRVLVLTPAAPEPRELFNRPGDALWQHAISKEIAIADDADVAVFSSGTGNLQLNDPQAYMSLGNLEVVDLKSGKTSSLGHTVFQGSIAVDKSGKQVFAIAGYDRTASKELPNASAKAKISEGLDQQPILVQIAVSNGNVTPLVPAWKVLPKISDKELVFCDFENKLFTLDLVARKVTPVDIPDYVLHIAAFQSPGQLFGTAKQARMEDIQMTKNNGMPGPRAMGRVVSINTEKSTIADLYPTIDPRTPYSYSPWSWGATTSGKP